MDEIRARSLEETLRLFGRQLMDSYMSKALLGVFRIAIIEHVRFPFLIRRFYDLGPGLASARLAELLLEAQRRGDLREGDCAMAADPFVAMIRGNVHLQVDRESVVEGKRVTVRVDLGGRRSSKNKKRLRI